MRIPKVAADGSMEQDTDHNIIFEKKYREQTCYHIAHREIWKKKFEEESKRAAVSAEAKYTEEENEEDSSRSCT